MKQMGQLFEELKRRNVLRVAIAYIVTAWLLLQVADVVLNNIEAPDWVFQAILLLVALGFPFAVIFAWAFELTPEGLKREHEVDRSESITLLTGRKLDFAIIGLLAIAVVFLVVDNYVLVGEPAPVVTEQTEPAIPPVEKSIAVLPFANRSASEEDAFFVDGLHDDLLTQISKIGSIKTISRTSVMRYRDTDKSLPEIAEELGVVTIMEGGVQRVEDRVRINVQLIDALTDEHLWAETYDREMTTTDIFAIQADIANRVARALEVELTAEEATRIEVRPTVNLEAYEYYLRANARSFRGYKERDIRSAIQMYQNAVTLDPEFSVAHARLSHAHTQMYWFGYDRSLTRRDSAQTALRNAMALAPDHPETRMAAGYNYYYLSNDYDRALKEFELARQVQPSLSNALAASGYVHRRLGQMRAAVEYIGRAVELDPNSGLYVFNLGETHLLLRDFDEAESYFARAIELLPVWPRPPSYMARMHLLRDGNFEEARRVLEAAEARGAIPLEDATFLYHWYWVDLVAGDYEAGLKRIDTQAWDVIETQFFVLPAGLLKGELQTLLGNATAAGIQFQVAQSLLRARLLTEPDDERLQSALGRTLAGLRKFDDALTHGTRGLELMPRERDAYKTTFRLEDLARIQAAAGNHTEATRHFETLLAGPSLLTAELLRLDPRLTQLRTEPDFAALVGGSQ